MKILIRFSILVLVELILLHPGYSQNENGDTIDPYASYKAARQSQRLIKNHRASALQETFMEKSAIAKSSIEAATTAQAAFFGKHILLRSLEKLYKQAQHVYTVELTQLEVSKKAASMAIITAQQAAEHVETLTETLKSAQLYGEKTKLAADYANAEFMGQKDLVTKAQIRLDAIEKRLDAARSGISDMQIAAEKAAGVAQEAQTHAVSAAVLAAMEFQQEAAKLNFREDNSLLLEDSRAVPQTKFV